jgi:hypothetical protein
MTLKSCSAALAYSAQRSWSGAPAYLIRRMGTQLSISLSLAVGFLVITCMP